MGITRQTKQVKILLEILTKENRAISVVDLVKSLETKMNKTTVYRILDKLMEDGVVHSFIGKKGLKWYAKCQDCSGEQHQDLHPHFQCNVCGKTKCLSESFPVPTIKGYTVDTASMLMTGTCNHCS